ncbi:MAG: hypothetical protein E7039_00560 [Lentisphaerae bacterium]|nr:hypothetical protein [Lentisphaerota bacterium]
MKKSIALLLCSGAVCCSAAIQPAVAFRFDDNHNIRIWDTLSDVFRRNNVRFSCSIIPYWSNDLNKADWCKKICQLESEGFEIMDHTPNHNTSAITLPEDDPRWGTLKDAPFVDHINGRKVCLKYSVGNSTFSKPFTIKIFDKNKVTSSSKLARRMNLEIDGKHYYLDPTKDKNVFKLVTIWNEGNVNLPDGEKTVRRCLKERFLLADGGYDFMIQCSQDGFRKIGLKKMPRVWIQPGGFYPHLSIDKLMAALRRHNYISASCAENASMKGFADPGIEQSRFSMRWGDFNLEKLNLQPAKTRIANTIACRRVAICSSHVAPERKYGKLKEYAAMYEQILPWLKENNIKVMTQGELAEYLMTAQVDPDENIMPAMNKDIDENNIPDGYLIKKSCKWNKAEQSLLLKGKGLLLSVKELCGLPRGKVRFTVEVKGKVNGSIAINLLDSLKNNCGKALIELKDSNEWQKYEAMFSIPENCAALNLDFIAKLADCNIRNPELRTVK